MECTPGRDWGKKGALNVAAGRGAPPLPPGSEMPEEGPKLFKMGDMEGFGSRTERHPGSKDERLWCGSGNPSHSWGIHLGLGIGLSWNCWS